MGKLKFFFSGIENVILQKKVGSCRFQRVVLLHVSSNFATMHQFDTYLPKITAMFFFLEAMVFALVTFESSSVRFGSRSWICPSQMRSVMRILLPVLGIVSHALPYCAYVPGGNTTTKLAWNNSDIQAIWRTTGGILINQVPAAECGTSTTTVSVTTTTSTTQSRTSTSSTSSTTWTNTTTSMTSTSSTSGLYAVQE